MPDRTATQPTSVLSRPLLPASIAIYSILALAAFEGLAVAAALPQVAADLGQVVLLPWVITAYLLMSGVATVTAGPLLDALGVRIMFRISVALFAAAGTLAAFVPTMPLMITVRVVQGIGAGLLIATGLAAVGVVYPPHLVGRAFAANSTVWGVMGVAAPALAAAMLTALSWRWIFLINLPLGLLALVVGWRVLPGPQTTGASRTLDGYGIAMVLVLNLAVLLAIDGLNLASIAYLAVAVGTAWLYLRHARRRPDPVMRLRHLIGQPYGPLALSVALLLTGGMTAHVFVPLYVQGGRGAGPALTAWSVLFFTVGWTTGANLSSRLLDRYAETSVMKAGFASTSGSLALLTASAWVDAPLPLIFAILVGVGIGIGMATNAALTLLRTQTELAELGRVNAAHQFYRNQGFAFGSALGGTVMLVTVGRAVGDIEQVRDLLTGSSTVESTQVAAAIADGFATSATIGLAIAVVSLVPFVTVRRHLAPARSRAEHQRHGGAGGPA